MGLTQPLPYEQQNHYSRNKEAAILWKHRAGKFTAFSVDYLDHHPGVNY